MKVQLAGLLMVAFMAANVSCKSQYFKQSFGWSSFGLPINEFIEVDDESNIEVFRVKQRDDSADALQAVLDFEKGLIGIYMPKVKGCFLIGGIDKAIEKPKDLKESLKAKSSEERTTTELSYVVRQDYTVKDKTLLPSKLSAVCKDRPIYWLERSGEKKIDTSNQLSRRFFNVGNGNFYFGTPKWMINTNIVSVNGNGNSINNG